MIYSFLLFLDFSYSIVQIYATIIIKTALLEIIFKKYTHRK